MSSKCHVDRMVSASTMKREATKPPLAIPDRQANEPARGMAVGRRSMHRRSFLIGTGVLASGVWAGRIGAQNVYPSRAVTVINPFPPGGVSDTITRPLNAALEAVLKQPFILENRPGAAGAVGAQFVATAKPDG